MSTPPHPPDSNTQLTTIARKLATGQFIQIRSTPDGLPYCPRQSMAMASYLWTSRFEYITTEERLETLKQILNTTEMPPERREKINRVMAIVFPPDGPYSLSQYHVYAPA
jgi:hypothetical protein